MYPKSSSYSFKKYTDQMRGYATPIPFSSCYVSCTLRSTKSRKNSSPKTNSFVLLNCCTHISLCSGCGCKDQSPFWVYVYVSVSVFHSISFPSKFMYILPISILISIHFIRFSWLVWKKRTRHNTARNKDA